jgi:hypothetical protein
MIRIRTLSKIRIQNYGNAGSVIIRIRNLDFNGFFYCFRTNKCAVEEVTDDQRQQAKQVTSFLKEQFNEVRMRKPIDK